MFRWEATIKPTLDENEHSSEPACTRSCCASTGVDKTAASAAVPRTAPAMVLRNIQSLPSAGPPCGPLTPIVGENEAAVACRSLKLAGCRQERARRGAPLSKALPQVPAETLDPRTG